MEQESEPSNNAETNQPTSSPKWQQKAVPSEKENEPSDDANEETERKHGKKSNTSDGDG